MTIALVSIVLLSAVVTCAGLLRADQDGTRTPLALVCYVFMVQTAMLIPITPGLEHNFVVAAGTALFVLSCLLFFMNSPLPFYLVRRVLSVPDPVIRFLPFGATLLVSVGGMFMLLQLRSLSSEVAAFCFWLCVSTLIQGQYFVREKRRWLAKLDGQVPLVP